MSTDIEWEKWGVQDPYFSILTDPKFRMAGLTPEARQDFFASGQAHVETVLNACRTYLDPDLAPRRILEFGCGVGRLALPFAKIADEAVGVDISDTMLAEARRNSLEQGVANAVFIKSDDDLSAVEGLFDLVHSVIVLQHIEIARGRILFARLVDKVRPGGCGVIQVTFGWDVHDATFGVPPALPEEPPPIKETGLLAQTKASLKHTLTDLGLLAKRSEPEVVEPIADPDPEMQMNFYNMSELLYILQRRGVQRFHAEFSDHGGALGVVLYFRKPDPV